MDKLSSRERRILEARVMTDKPVPLEELAAELGIARVRVRQIEARVREKMMSTPLNRRG
jgi:RNA polymerase sigma-32 factor